MEISITPEQKAEFLSNGFLHLSNAIPPAMLQRWRQLLDEAANGEPASGDPSTMLYLESPEKPLLARINDLLKFNPDAVLDLLASPAIIAIFNDLCGKDAIPLQCDALIKHKHPESAVLWHQDVIVPRALPYVNIGIYLDDSEEDDGCLRCIPGTQFERQEICDLVREHGWNIPGTVSIPVKAGDVIVHDMMVLHASQAKQKDSVRRTIYVEARSFTDALQHGVHSEQWLQYRKCWKELILRRSNGTQSDSERQRDAEAAKELFQLREAPLPANYCHEPISGPGYPG